MKMKFKKFIILMFFILISFLTINMVNSTECESEAANIFIQKDELNDKNTNFCCDLGSSRLWGGGGIANSNIGIGSGATGGGGGGAAVIALTIFLSQEAIKFFDSLKPSTCVAYGYNPTIDDILSDKAIKDAMNEYGWDRNELIKYLEMMLDTTCENFLNDDGIEVYLGASDYELKYYDYREKTEHKYAFHTDDTKWKELENVCSNLKYKPSWCPVEEYTPYDRIWVINMAFLQMAIIKNATFVLVTPNGKYYDYDKKEAKEFPMKNNPNKKYTPFYGKELKHINAAGYQWSDFTTPEVRTNKK